MTLKYFTTSYLHNISNYRKYVIVFTKKKLIPKHSVEHYPVKHTVSVWTLMILGYVACAKELAFHVMRTQYIKCI